MIELGGKMKGAIASIIRSSGDILDLGKRVNVPVFSSCKRRERFRKELAWTRSSRLVRDWWHSSCSAVSRKMLSVQQRCLVGISKLTPITVLFDCVVLTGNSVGTSDC